MSYIKQQKARGRGEKEEGGERTRSHNSCFIAWLKNFIFNCDITELHLNYCIGILPCVVT